MLISKIIKNKHFIVKRLPLVKKILTIATLASLLLLKPKPNKILTDQFLHEFVPISKNIILDYKNINDFDFNKKEFRIGNESCAKTILIKGDLQNIVQLLTIYSTLKNAKYLHRSIVIKIEENRFFEKFPAALQSKEYVLFKNRYKGLVKGVKSTSGSSGSETKKVLQTKMPFKAFSKHFSTKITKIDAGTKRKIFLRDFIRWHKDLYSKVVSLIAKKCVTNDSKYFAVLKLKFSSKTWLIVDILKNYMPNSDLLFVAKHYFDTKIVYNHKNFFFTGFDNNVLQINLQSNLHSFGGIVTLIRTINNLHSYALGNYYYIPLHNTNIALLQAFPFIVLTFFNNFIEYYFGEKDEFIEFFMVVFGSVYLITPIVSFIVIFWYKNYPAKKAFFALFFSIVNFKFGILYCLFLLIQNFSIKNKLS